MSQKFGLLLFGTRKARLYRYWFYYLKQNCYFLPRVMAAAAISPLSEEVIGTIYAPLKYKPTIIIIAAYARRLAREPFTLNTQPRAYISTIDNKKYLYTTANYIPHRCTTSQIKVSVGMPRHGTPDCDMSSRTFTYVSTVPWYISYIIYI